MDHTNENCISFPVGELDRLLGHGDGNAALLYLHVRRKGGLSLDRAARELKCTQAELLAAAEKLRSLGLLDGPSPAVERETPEFTAQDVSRLAATDAAFQAVVSEAERVLGRVLSSNDLKLLVGIYDYWGLPADVIMLLLHYCVERYQAMHGSGRLPAMRYIEKEAQSWAREEIVTQEAAEEHIAREKRRQEDRELVRSALQIRDRGFTASEEKYVAEWLSLGFGPELIAEAYDRTVIGTGKLTWKYMDRIIHSWDEKKLYTLEAVEQGDSRRKTQPRADMPALTDDSEKLEAMRRLYIHLGGGSEEGSGDGI
ncbi:MAG: DnaD domain protein [Oscillospiraceae bacterium]|nr:DnaD domain protein [Oscillospiraceae bacterium]